MSDIQSEYAEQSARERGFDEVELYTTEAMTESSRAEN
jgi:hypothetical protein